MQTESGPEISLDNLEGVSLPGAVVIYAVILDLGPVWSHLPPEISLSCTCHTRFLVHNSSSALCDTGKMQQGQGKTLGWSIWHHGFSLYKSAGGNSLRPHWVLGDPETLHFTMLSGLEGLLTGFTDHKESSNYRLLVSSYKKSLLVHHE